MLKHTAMMVVAFTSILLNSLVVHAQSAGSEYLHQNYISARVMGMGGAFTALADDYNALYFNAAGLGRMEKGEVNINLASVGLTPSIVNFYNNISAAGSNTTTLNNLLQSNYGSHYSMRVDAIDITYVKSGFGLAIRPTDLTAEMDVHANAGASIGVTAYQDTTVQFGLGWSVGEKKSFSFGIAPKAVYRAFIQKEVLALDLASNSNIIQPSDASEGLTIDTDVGFLYTFQVPDSWWMKPSLGVAVINAVDEGFNSNFHAYNGQSTNITNPDGKLGRRVDVGSRFDLPDFWAFKSRFMFDVHDIGERYASVNKSIHTGVELLWKANEHITGAYRIGYSEGYYTAGFSFNLSFLTFDVATYSEEIGTSSAPKESRRYLAQVSFDF